MDVDDAFAIGEEAVRKLVQAEGAAATFPSDELLKYGADQVPSESRPAMIKRLVSAGLLEKTGAQTRATSAARKGSPTTEYRPGNRFQPLVRPTADRLPELAQELLLPSEWLEEVIDLLRERGQVIMQGPPGTGKTYIARALADYVTQKRTNVELVQFHPSYTYEDFVQGYRPRLDSGHLGFILENGPLLRLAERAEANPEGTYVLLIDELNRGNVPRVLGELYFLLEYREADVTLQYGEGATFRLPGNLLLLGTMNTADRSIALLDSALRRRFYFVDLYPDSPPIDGLLKRWLEGHGLLPGLSWLPELVISANELVVDRNHQVGPSFFLSQRPDELDETRIARIWRRGVLPYLEEYFVDQPDMLDQLTFDALRSSSQTAPEPANETGE